MLRSCQTSNSRLMWPRWTSLATSPDPTVMLLIQQSEPVLFPEPACLRDSHDRFYKLSVHPVEGGDSREEGASDLDMVFRQSSCQLSWPGERVLDLQLSRLYDQVAWDPVACISCSRNRIIDYPGEDIFEGGCSTVFASSLCGPLLGAVFGQQMFRMFPTFGICFKTALFSLKEINILSITKGKKKR